MPESHVTDPAQLHGRTAVVTGAASGIGAAVATRLAEAGASLVVVDRDADGAERVADLVRGKALVLDLSDGDAVTAAMAGMDADILVNNAGIQHVAPIEDFDPQTFRTIHAIMLEAPFRLAKALLPGMYARGWGRMVHVSSVHGHRASAYKSAYVSAKHGLEGLSKVIALEGAEHGVTSNTVCPGYVRTPLVEGQIADQARTHDIPEDDVVEKVLLERSALKRLVEPGEVADVVHFLCTDSARSVTGTSYLMDGGWTAA
ncbi:3-hydroxybutyrate dehydrogenase [Nocardioides currus]|uniref:3-hydroxybutyrate dehydrogenase n=1 Tax=Nocardioides currus TaxID=2133958 RepID=A0A2R7YZR5_9ACTN|nr:3-hydroxybutyrate dehydrogenase [Nocardioides currus]PUA81878.1 3-hydroxybutyrate dehydrogenase [Nocardioides currus]